MDIVTLYQENITIYLRIPYWQFSGFEEIEFLQVSELNISLKKKTYIGCLHARTEFTTYFQAFL